MAHVSPVLLALLVLGCSHAEPFAVSDPVQDGPFAPDAVVRLTYGAGVSPASWLPAGDTLVLAARDDDRHEGDVCLFRLPAAGGTRQGGYCSTGHAQSDSVEDYGSPAVSRDRTLAVRYFHRRLGGSTFGAIRIGPLATPFVATEITSVPFFQDGRLMHNVSDLAWQPDGSLVFLAWTDEILERTCGPRRCDVLLRIPFGAYHTTPNPDGAPRAVPGSFLATSITPDGQGGLFATFPASDQLWRISPDGDSVVVHDFGAGSKVRGADYRAGKVAVILGGTEVVATDDIGVIQTDDGVGVVTVLDLASGTTAVVSPPNMLFRDPVLSPDGRSVVARGGQLTTAGGDLWRMTVP